MGAFRGARPARNPNSRLEEKSMRITVLCYEKCSTCRKALAWLDARGVEYVNRPIREAHPDEGELRAWRARSGPPLKRFFNTSGQKYRELNLKERLGEMGEDAQYALLASDGMLVKRPLLVTDGAVCPGFREAEWERILSEN